MFKIECFVDDKKLADAMRALTGLAQGIPQAVPVANAQTQNGKVVAKTTGKVPELFTQWVKEKKVGDTVTPSMLKTFAVDVGRSPGSYSSLLTQIKAAGLLRKGSGKGNAITYKVVNK